MSLVVNDGLVDSDPANAAIGMIEQGIYEDALDKLENDIIGKTDGCANSGAPDKNDWLTDCASQNQYFRNFIF